MIKRNIHDLVLRATDNFTKIIFTDDIKEQYPELYWGGNGVGDRWLNKKYNYSIIYSNKTIRLYSENENDEIPPNILQEINYKTKSIIIGLFVHSNQYTKTTN